MKGIADNDFLLRTETARELYHGFAEKQPIIDYHCHLNPAEIAEDRRFDGIGELMLAGDHYKWRAMRSYGIGERFITGDADWRDKFRAYAETVMYAPGNPLYAWTSLELKRYFGIDEALTDKSADRIYDRCGELLASDSFSARGLISMSGVETLCTTDDPGDSLLYHEKIKDSGFSVSVLPTFRPDKAVNIRNASEFRAYMEEHNIDSMGALCGFLNDRIGYFHAHGCRLSDHGLERAAFVSGDPEGPFAKAMRGEKLTSAEEDAFITYMMLFLGGKYAEKGWCMQLHLGPMRNNNHRMFERLGRDTGFDSIGAQVDIFALCGLLGALDAENRLPKTILYSLDGNDNYRLGALMGSFQEAPFRSKIQLGSAWWFNDQRDGMEAQLKAFANLGILGCFIGMLTDSRSFISYPRHEYFRRILCSVLGDWVENGEYPRDIGALGKIVGDISYFNAKNYFAFG